MRGLFMNMSRIVFNRQLAADKMTNLTDEQLFTSEGFRDTVEDVVRGVSKTFNAPLKVNLAWLTPRHYVAFVQGFNVIALNTNNIMVQGKDRLGRYRILMGIVLHECGHRLFTDFSYFEGVVKRMYATKSLDGAPHLTAAMAGMSAPQLQMVGNLFHTIQNTIEDGFIELVLLTMFPGYGTYLQELRDLQLGEADSIAEMRRNGLKDEGVLHNLLLTYAKYGVVKFEDEAVEKLDPAYLIFEKVMPVVAAARVEKSFAKRVSACAKILDAFWEALASAVQPQDDGAAQSQQGQPGQGQQSQSSGSGEDAASEGKGRNSDSDEADASEEEGSSSASEGEGISSSDEDGEGSYSPASGGADGGNPASMEDILNALGNMPMQRDESQCGSSVLSAGQDASDEVDEPSEPTTGNSSDEQKLEEMAKKEAEQQAADDGEKALRKEVENKLANVDVGSIHKGIACEFKDVPKGKSDDFALLLAELKPVYDALCKKFAKDIKDRLEYSWEDGLYTGARLTAPYRKDMKRFANRLVPEEDFDMAVSLYIDLSGSMADDVGTDNLTAKSEVARRTAVIMYRFCEALGIPLQVIGHNGYRTVSLWRFKEFDSCDGRDLDRISQLNRCVGSSNRDGYGLRLCCEELTKRREKCRLMFIVSDGEPAGCDGYYDVEPGTLPKMDIDDILTSYGRKGIKFVAAGLGDYAAPVRRLYQEGLSPRVAAQFIDITDVSTMPKTFVNIIKKYLD